MTNSWTDIANATFVLVWGANPTENHPACMAHVNRARFPKTFFDPTSARGMKPAAKMIVIDPRKTRTALQADAYVRIRPGTDIAMINGLLNMIITKIESGAAGLSAAGVPIADNFTAYLNQSAPGTFNTDGNATAKSVNAANNVPNQAKYTDARFVLNQPDGTADDYYRHRVVAATDVETAIAPDATTISDFPLKSTDARVNVTVGATTYPTVYNALKAHVAHYTADVVADICGCSTADIEMVADALIQNSRHASYNPMAAADATNANYRATTILYAMGITQHTCGSATIKGFATLQSVLGNMGRAGGGINALRGIHNVQGSTDMGLLYANIPGYSYNPTVQPSTDANAFGKYMDSLWGNPLSGSNGKTMDGTYGDAYDAGKGGLQQRGFYNMTLKWFGDWSAMPAGGTDAATRTKVDALYSLWPKGNGDNHVKMFRHMIDHTTKGLLCWGQNPAVTEPNQSKIRAGLKELNTLVVVDLFETETAKVDRKAGGLTFLLPTAAHVEKAGSATNSARALQWRYAARTPAGNSKDDNELLLMFAKEFDGAGAFAHIKTVWEANSIFGYSAGSPVPVYGVYNKLYAALYLGADTNTWSTASLPAADIAAGEVVEAAAMRPAMTSSNVEGTYSAMATPMPSEIVAENLYREMTRTGATGGTIWLYVEAYDFGGRNTISNGAAVVRLNNVGGVGYQKAWGVANRAKSRGLEDPGQLGFHKWGYSWLVNRRVLYNNGEVMFDQGDFFMSPDSVSRLFAPKHMPASTLYGTSSGTATPVFNYSRWYRTHGGATSHVLYDMPRIADNSTPAVHVYPGRFPSYTEPYETNRPDLALAYGYNSTDNDKTNTVGYRNLLYNENAVGGTATGEYGLPSEGKFPLLLTTIRCVEHFQGGPITRNNSLNVELEPQPWIEINSVDAGRWGIKNGDMVDVITARSNSTSDQLGRTPNYVSTGSATDTFGQGFKARVGVGTPSSQRVAPGVVAIPWHWGDSGLSTGSRANDLCIDAIDADSTIPESKVCLCKIVRIP